MGIGLKPSVNKEEENRTDPIIEQSTENTANSQGVPESVASSPQMKQVSADSNRAVDSLKGNQQIDKAPASGNKKNLIILLAAVVVFCIIAALVINFMNNKEKNKTPTIDDGTVATTEVPSDDGSSDDGSNDATGDELVPDSGGDSSAESTTSSNPNAVYDDNGNLISENGIYDQDGNIISDKKNLIDPGNAYKTTEADDTSSTSATVYSASDFIKDLNGLDISAVYNVKSISYVHDYANYEKKRAIMDQGMELYWFELQYKGLHYRMQVCYDDYKNYDDTGIVQVNLEVLNLEGGEKVISFAEVAHTDESN